MSAITRTQTGVRIETRVLNVLKALCALKGMTLGDLLEGIVLHAFDGKPAFSDQTLAQIADLKRVYGLDLSADDSHKLVESESQGTAKKGAKSTKRTRR